MHFEILIEDVSGKKALDVILPKILEKRDDTYKVISYRGIGHIPKNLHKSKADPAKRILLDRLPKLLRGYGSAYRDYEATVIVVCDLDKKKKTAFLNELAALLNTCNPKPNAQFCLAVEEGEAWLLGDIDAVLKAYPKAKKQILFDYENDSICGTWECLADAVYPGGSTKLSQEGWQAIGREKSLWAERICPLMNVRNNQSPSFNTFISLIDAGK